MEGFFDALIFGVVRDVFPAVRIAFAVVQFLEARQIDSVLSVSFIMPLGASDRRKRVVKTSGFFFFVVRRHSVCRIDYNDSGETPPLVGPAIDIASAN